MKKALTLIELIAVIVILGIVGAISTQVVLISYDLRSNVSIQEDLENRAAAVLATISGAMRTSVDNSVRLRSRVISAEGDNCLNGGCLFLRDVQKDLVSDHDYHTLEMALKLRPWGDAPVSLVESRCVINAMLNLNQWGGAAQTNPCYIRAHSVFSSAPNDDTKQIFRCFSTVFPSGLIGSDGKPIYSCNARLISSEFLATKQYDLAQEEKVEIEQPSGATATINAIAGNAIGFNYTNTAQIHKTSAWYGLHFRGENIANSSTFLERDVYPSRMVLAKEPDNANNLLENWAHWQVLMDLKEKNFTISNSFDLIAGVQYFEVDANNQLIAGVISYHDYIKRTAADTQANLQDSSVANSLRASAGETNATDADDPFSPITITGAGLRTKLLAKAQPHVLANNVSRFIVGDFYGQRMVSICLTAPRPRHVGVKLQLTNNIEVCRSEVL